MDELRFDGRVAIVTGAGGGLGREHALLLARRGCRVLVNDLGASRAGEGSSLTAAERVVEEIRAAGGIAQANGDSVEDGERIVAAALEAFGRIDVVINNAGILRDAAFHKMTAEEWDLVYRVHLLGAERVTRAAWPHLRNQGFGRVLVTTSAAGLYGNFGQANYAAAKLGLVGLAKTLAVEGRSKGIHVNAIAPIAGSRMTESVMPQELVDALKPGLVSPLVAWLCHESCAETGGVFEVGGGWVGAVRWQRAAGGAFSSGALTPEAVRDGFARIGDWSAPNYPTDLMTAMAPMVEAALPKKRRGNDLIDVDAALGYEFPEVHSGYDARDVSLYALGVGAGELPFVWESHPGFAPLPTFAVVPAVNVVIGNEMAGRRAPGFNFGLDRILHSEQYTELKRPWPAAAKLRHRLRVKAIYDRTKYAIVVTEARTVDEAGEELACNEMTMTVRGAGGWGGEPGPNPQERHVAPERAPDAVIEQRTREDQALLYRLSGDVNPLHVDPEFAENFGLPKPILHGLCTYGFAARHVLRAFAGDDVKAFRSIRARFAAPAYPGETLVTEMWRESDSLIVFRTKAKERDKVVLSNAAVELAGAAAPARPVPAPAPAPAPSSPGAQVLERLARALRPELLASVGAILQLRLRDPAADWVLDLKNAPGAVRPGIALEADAALQLADADLAALARGEPVKELLGQGRLKVVSGDLRVVHKLGFFAKLG